MLPSKTTLLMMIRKANRNNCNYSWNVCREIKKNPRVNLKNILIPSQLISHTWTSNISPSSWQKIHLIFHQFKVKKFQLFLTSDGRKDVFKRNFDRLSIIDWDWIKIIKTRYTRDDKNPLIDCVVWKKSSALTANKLAQKILHCKSDDTSRAKKWKGLV